MKKRNSILSHRSAMKGWAQRALRLLLAGAAVVTAPTGFGQIVGQATADLVVSKQVSEPEADEGNPVTYEITVHNAGPGAATQVEVVDTMPAGLTIDASLSNIGNCQIVEGRVICRLERLEPQQSFHLQVVATPEVEGDLTNRVTVTGLEPDPNPQNNLAFAALKVFRRLDYGDAPDPSYPTLRVNNGARHRILRGWHLGAAIDREPNGQPNAAATGDDIAGVADEDGVTFLSSLVSGTVATIQVVASTNGFLDAWIDFNADGVWNAPEQIFASQALVRGLNVLNFPVPLVPSRATFARFRFSHAGGLTPVGYAPSGEVEDYRVEIKTDEFDYGDAPDPTYRTLLASNGARHRLSPLFLGMTIDSEPDGQPTAAADGDDTAGVPDDEDGVRWISGVFVGKPFGLEVRVSGAGFVDAWMDFNHNGVWEPAEQILTSRAVVPGVNVLTCLVPAGIGGGDTHARFRLSSMGGLAPFGPAADGEVEDYMVRIRKPVIIVPVIPHWDDGRLVLTWENPEAILEEAPRPRGPWQVVDDATSPYEVEPVPGQHKFYRLRMAVDRNDLRAKLRRADLVFEGVVTEVSYRNSDVDAQHPVSYPNTFVTFLVEHVIKGQYARDTITLRFLGGLAPDGKVMALSHSTLFDVGERSILFVRKNGRVAVPLVNGSEGRLRIINGMVYSEDGQAMVWTKSATIGFESGALPDEVAQDQIGDTMLERVRQAPTSSEDEPAQPTLSARQVTAVAFKEVLSGLDDLSVSTGEFVGPGQVQSVSIQDRFTIPQPVESGMVAGPTIGRDVVGNDQERLEQEEYEANGGNPVLN